MIIIIHVGYFMYVHFIDTLCTLIKTKHYLLGSKPIKFLQVSLLPQFKSFYFLYEYDIK